MTRISDAVVHEVCSYLRKANEPGPCENCQAVIQTPYGPGTQACYALAHEAIEVVLRAYRKAGWQPIETAPWSGPPVLLWKANTQEQYVAARIRGEHGPGWCTPDGHQIFNATHWMPLPAAPEPREEL